MSAFLQHRDGGIYQQLYVAKNTVDSSSVVVYQHIWPFEQSIWVRPYEEFWDGRFVPISANVALDATTGDKLLAQAAINKAKAIRKGLNA